MKKLMLLALFAVLVVAFFAAPALAHPGHIGAYDYGCGYWSTWYYYVPYSGLWGQAYQYCHGPFGWFVNWGLNFKV